MLRKSDVQWWVLEAKKQPESAPALIEELAKRLAELDAENERLRDELVRLQRHGPAETADSDEIKALRHQVQRLQSLLDNEQSTELSVLFLSHRLQSARVSLSQARRMARQGRPALDKRAMLALHSLLTARPHDELLLLNTQGQGFKVQISNIPRQTQNSVWAAIDGLFLSNDERLSAALTVGQQPRFWTVVTRRGYVQRFVRVIFDRRLAQGESLLKTSLHNDAPTAVVSGDLGDVLLLTRWGKGVRFAHRAIEGQGVTALELDPDDEIVAALSLPADIEILIVTASGHVLRRDTSRIAVRSRPGGKGRQLIQAHDVLAVFPYSAQEQLLYLSYSGKLTFISVADVPLQERTGKGLLLRDMSLDPAVAVALVPEDLL